MNPVFVRFLLSTTLASALACTSSGPAPAAPRDAGVETSVVNDCPTDASTGFCATRLPGMGEICPSCDRSYRCAYDGGCGPDADIIAICSGGHWLVGSLSCDGG